MQPEDVSRSRRLLQVFSSVVFCFFLAGVVFGFAAIKPILLDSGVYSYLCPDDPPCKAQDTKLNFLFVVASSLNNIAALPMGTFLDHVGPRTASLCGGIFFLAGTAIFSLGIIKPYFDSYLVGFALLGLSSPALILSQFHLSNAFPERSGLVLGAITGAFDASSLSLCFYKLAYFHFGGRPSIKTFFLCYAIVPVLLIVQQLTFGPSSLYIRTTTISSQAATETIPPPISSPGPLPPISPRPDRVRRLSSFSRVTYDIRDHADEREVKAVMSQEGQDRVVGVLYGQSAISQIQSSWWLVMEFMVIVHMTRINWYLTTVASQLVYYTGNSSLANDLTNAFIFLLPLGGIFSVPAIGYLLDTRPVLHAVYVMSALAFLFGLLTMTPNLIAQLVGIGLLVVFRPLFYTAISDYASKVFGIQTFGTVYGLAMTLSGLCGFILTPFDLITKTRFNGSYTPVNTLLLVLGLLSSATMSYRIWRHTRTGAVKLTDTVPRGEPDVIEEEEEETGG